MRQPTPASPSSDARAAPTEAQRAAATVCDVSLSPTGRSTGSNDRSRDSSNPAGSSSNSDDGANWKPPSGGDSKPTTSDGSNDSGPGDCATTPSDEQHRRTPASDGRAGSADSSQPTSLVANPNDSSQSASTLTPVDRPAANLTVSGLPRHIDSPQLAQAFAKYGPIRSAMVMLDTHSGRSRGFGFVWFEEEEHATAAAAATHGASVKDIFTAEPPPDDECTPEEVDWRDAKLHVFPSHAPSCLPDTRAVLFTNWPGNVSRDEARVVLAASGTITAVVLGDVSPARKYPVRPLHVVFATPAEALRAVSNLHGVRTLVVKGREVRLPLPLVTKLGADAPKVKNASKKAARRNADSSNASNNNGSATSAHGPSSGSNTSGDGGRVANTQPREQPPEVFSGRGSHTHDRGSVAPPAGTGAQSTPIHIDMPAALAPPAHAPVPHAHAPMGGIPYPSMMHSHLHQPAHMPRPHPVMAPHAAHALPMHAPHHHYHHHYGPPPPPPPPATTHVVYVTSPHPPPPSVHYVPGHHYAWPPY